MSLFDDPPLHDFPDRAFRRLLENPANLRDLLADLLPDLVARFDFARIEPVGREFLLDDWRRRESDLFFRLPFLPGPEGEAEPPAFVCLLLEHQSQPERWMPLRVLLYAVLYWDGEWRASEAAAGRDAESCLTPVIPIIFHTGPRPWRASREMADLFRNVEALRIFSPRWPLLFWDLAEKDPGELLKATGEWLVALAAVRADREPKTDYHALLQEVFQTLEPLSRRDTQFWPKIAS